MSDRTDQSHDDALSNLSGDPGPGQLEEPADHHHHHHHHHHHRTGDSDDEDLPLPTCPLCLYDEVLPECASIVPSDNSYMRRIMAIELHHTGIVPDDVVYTNIARHYNKHIHKPRLQAGLESTRWTLPMVREHFEKHVGIVPRRILGKEIMQCKQMLASVEKELSTQKLCAAAAMAEAMAGGGNPQTMEFIDAKSVKKWCDLQGKLLPMVEKYRQFQKEDSMAVGLSTLWRSIGLGETSTQDAAKLLESAAALQTAAGSGDMPKASELFN